MFRIRTIHFGAILSRFKVIVGFFWNDFNQFGVFPNWSYKAKNYFFISDDHVYVRRRLFVFWRSVRVSEVHFIAISFGLYCVISGCYLRSNCWMLFLMNRRLGVFVKKLSDTTFIICVCFRHIFLFGSNAIWLLIETLHFICDDVYSTQVNKYIYFFIIQISTIFFYATHFKRLKSFGIFFRCVFFPFSLSLSVFGSIKSNRNIVSYNQNRKTEI